MINERSAATGTLVRTIHHVPWAFLLGLALIGFFALPWSLELSIGGTLGCGIALTLLAVFMAFNWPVVRRPFSAHPRMFVAVIAAGCVLRVLYILFVPPVQLSDMADYLMLAQRLLAGEGYQQDLKGHQLFAYRAPGYSFLLAGVLWLVREAMWAPMVLNIICYVATALVLNALVVRLAGLTAGLWCVSAFAFWPSGIMSTGLAMTEPVSLALLMVTAWSMLQARENGNFGWSLLAGLAIGLGILVRPSLLLLPALLMVLALLDRQDRRGAVQHALVSMLVAAACVMPWTVRNYFKLGSVVAVSSNGGDNLYRANNPLATGGFKPAGERNFDHLLSDEALWNRAQSAAAKEWILGHPIAFVRLSLRRAAIFMGDDTTGAYWSIQRAHGDTDNRGNIYRIAVTLSNTWWASLWICLFAALLRNRASIVRDVRHASLMWLAAVLPAVHMVFEAQPRYHMPIVGIVLSILAALIYKPKPQGKNLMIGDSA